MKLKVFTPDGTTSREEEFAGLPTFEGDKGLQAVKEVIVAINANNRLGTHSTKTRGEVRGGGKKPWQQKGTGLLSGVVVALCSVRNHATTLKKSTPRSKPSRLAALFSTALQPVISMSSNASSPPL
jgi:hypothetical protein